MNTEGIWKFKRRLLKKRRITKSSWILEREEMVKEHVEEREMDMERRRGSRKRVWYQGPHGNVTGKNLRNTPRTHRSQSKLELPHNPVNLAAVPV